MKILQHLSLIGLLSLFPLLTFGQTCDTLVLLSGKTMLVQEVQELGTTISYEKCGQDNDNTYVLNRDKVNQIKYGQRFLIDFLLEDSILSYNVWVYSRGKSLSTKGSLYSLNDTFILFKPAFTLPGRITKTHKINISNIDLLQIRDKGKVRRGMAIGSVIGTLTGIATGIFIIKKQTSIVESFGISSKPDYTPALSFGLIGGLAGTLIGGVIGSFKINLPINRNQAQYQKEKKRLECMLFD